MSQNFAQFGDNARLIDLPVISDPRGDLTFVEGNRHIVPVDSERGGHAHRELEQVVFALSGSFRIRIDDGTNKADVWLNNPKKGLYLRNMVWREIDTFSQGAVCMVLASQPYDEADYFRDYSEFLAAARR